MRKFIFDIMQLARDELTEQAHARFAKCVEKRHHDFCIEIGGTVEAAITLVAEKHAEQDESSPADAA